MHLVEYESLMQNLREQRRSLELTQKEVADKAEISPAQLSRMENGNAEAKYSTVYRVWETLQRAEPTEETAVDLCTKDIEWVTTNQTGRDAKELMTDYAFSQVPVREPDSMRAVGSVTDRLLMEVENIDRPINQLMTEPFSEIHPATSRSTIIQLLREADDAVLIRATKKKGYLGIVTPADVI